MDSYLPIVVMLVLSVGFSSGGFLLSALLSNKRPTLAKSAPYECGIVPSREPAERFPVRFYLVAMIFIIFDIEIIFLYPWAVVFGELDTFGLIEMVVFAVAVFISFLYLLSNGALDWGPTTTSRKVADAAVSPVRNARTTIRKVGRPVAGGAVRPEVPEHAA